MQTKKSFLSFNLQETEKFFENFENFSKFWKTFEKSWKFYSPIAQIVKVQKFCKIEKIFAFLLWQKSSLKFKTNWCLFLGSPCGETKRGWKCPTKSQSVLAWPIKAAHYREEGLSVREKIWEKPVFLNFKIFFCSFIFIIVHKAVAFKWCSICLSNYYSNSSRYHLYYCDVCLKGIKCVCVIFSF